MSNQNIYLKKDNGEFNGSISTKGKHRTPTIDIARKLHLGYKVETTPEVEQYLDARKKYDSAYKVWQDKEELASVREDNRLKMLNILDEVHSLPVESVLVGWEFYEKDREDKGVATQEIPYPDTVLTTIARSIEEGSVNPDSIEGFIPTRIREFTLPNGRVGYDVSYDDYMLNINFRDRNHIMVGANIEYIGLNITLESYKSYRPFSEGEKNAGFSEGENSIKENETVYIGVKNLEVLRRDVAEKPRLLKIRSLRFIAPLPQEAPAE